MVGTREGGGRRIATQLLRANDITSENTTFINEELGADAGALKNGQADAAILVLAADSDKVKQFEKEASLTQKLAHKSIIKVVEMLDCSPPAFVMELFESENLKYALWNTPERIVASCRKEASWPDNRSR